MTNGWTSVVTFCLDAAYLASNVKIGSHYQCASTKKKSKTWSWTLFQQIDNGWVNNLGENVFPSITITVN